MDKDLNLIKLLEISDYQDIVALRPGQFLFFEDDEADALYVLKRGTLRVIRGDTVYETLRAGSIVGEMAIIDERRRSASVIAGTYTELYRIDEAKFLSLVADTPQFALMVMRVMSGRLRKMNDRHRVRRIEEPRASPRPAQPLSTCSPRSASRQR